MSASHVRNITINLALDPAQLARAGFGNVLLLVALAANSLDGDRVRTYAKVKDAEDDNLAGFISSATLKGIQTGLSQRPKPAKVKVAYVDLANSETYPQALTVVQGVDDDFYGVSIDARTDAEIVAMSAAVEAKVKLLAVQSDSADLLTSGLPAALSTLAGKERTLICYHSDDDEWMDFALLANRLVYNPDTKSAPWDAPLKGVAGYSGSLTDGQRDFAIANNVNTGLPYGGENFYVDPGVNAAGRAVHEIVTGDWFETRLRERIAVLKVAHSARGEKIPISRVGQAKILAEVEGLLAEGVTAGHFEAGQTRVDGVLINGDDRDGARLRFEGAAQIQGSARLFEFGLNFSRQPVIEEEDAA